MAGPESISNAEIDRYSVTYAIDQSLIAAGWNVLVDQVRDLWPTADSIETPAVFVLMGDSSTAPWELGSAGKEREFFVHIYASNDSERDRLAEEICNTFRDIIPIYDWETGNESSPSIIGYFNTERDVRWHPVRPLINSPDVDRWHAVVQAVLTRDDA